MKIGKFKKYRGYTGSIKLTNNVYHGKIIKTDETITYEANSIEQLYKNFKKAVDSYIKYGLADTFDTDEWRL